MKITDFLVIDVHGDQIAADPYGNNLAFCCMACGHPVLAVALENKRGSDEEHPAICRACDARYFLEVREQSAKLYVHRVRD